MKASDLAADGELEFVLDLALRAGSRMLEASAAGAARSVRTKGGPIDLVTDVDREIDALVAGELTRRFPDDRLVGEEGAASEGRGDPSDAAWYVDPLDGTTNFVHGYPFWTVSIGRFRGEQPELGVVFAPALDELYWARKGAGAYAASPRAGVGPIRARASDCAQLGQALVATGFPYARGQLGRIALACGAHALERTQGLRRAGAASLDLCHVGVGRLDAYWELGLHPWDVAAGTVVAREAGARVCDFTGGDEFLFGERICACAPRLLGELLEMLAHAHRDPEHWPLGSPIRGPFSLRKEA